MGDDAVLFGVFDKNHAFVVLNRGQYFDKALFVDTYFRKSFFFAYMDVVNAAYKPDLSQEFCINCTSIIEPPQAPWPQTKTMEVFHELYGKIEEGIKVFFSDIGIVD